MTNIKKLLTNIKNTAILMSNDSGGIVMKSINKLGTVVTKIMEVFHWVGAVLMLAATICLVAAPKWVEKFVSYDGKECCGANLEVYGFEVNAPYANGKADMKHFLLFGIGAVLILIVMAMIFRNLHLIFKKSEKDTPFQKDNIRMMKEIGIFAIAVPVIGFIMSVIIRLVTNVDFAEISIDMGGIFMGIIVLCLTRFFVHGANLEKDVDGLL